MLFSITNTFEKKRKQMLREIKMTELSSKRAVEISQQVDVFINLLQRKYPYQTFHILCRENNPNIILTLAGHLDITSTEQMDIFRSSFQERFQGFTNLEIDLSQLTFLDSSGVNELYKLILTAYEINIKTKIKEAVGTVYDLLEMLGFFQLLKHL
jgi:anti-anti-sigma factor